jgi:hypothetical protein
MSKKYYYSSEYDICIKLWFEDEALLFDTGNGTVCIDKDNYQKEGNYTTVSHNGNAYKFFNEKTKKNASDCTTQLYPISEDQVVRINNRFCPFDKLSTVELLREAYEHLNGAVINSYLDQGMNDPDMVLRLLHRICWKLGTEFNIPDEIISFDNILIELKLIQDSSK